MRRALCRAAVPQAHLDEEVVAAICKEYRAHNCDITVRYANATVDDLIDVIEGNR